MNQTFTENWKNWVFEKDFFVSSVTYKIAEFSRSGEDESFEIWGIPFHTNYEDEIYRGYVENFRKSQDLFIETLVRFIDRFDDDSHEESYYEAGNLEKVMIEYMASLSTDEKELFSLRFMQVKVAEMVQFSILA